jgi:hypothetical protein
MPDRAILRKLGIRPNTRSFILEPMLLTAIGAVLIDAGCPSTSATWRPQLSQAETVFAAWGWRSFSHSKRDFARLCGCTALGRPVPRYQRQRCLFSTRTQPGRTRIDYVPCDDLSSQKNERSELAMVIKHELGLEEIGQGCPSTLFTVATASAKDFHHAAASRQPARVPTAGRLHSRIRDKR